VPSDAGHCATASNPNLLPLGGCNGTDQLYEIK
jgi:hypothetical protein